VCKYLWRTRLIKNLLAYPKTVVSPSKKYISFALLYSKKMQFRKKEQKQMKQQHTPRRPYPDPHLVVPPPLPSTLHSASSNSQTTQPSADKLLALEEGVGWVLKWKLC
jgi:hypothetical protein